MPPSSRGRRSTTARSLTLAALLGCQETGLSVVPPPEVIPAPRPVDAGWVTDRLMQSVAPVVDVLFVIDNSCSMGDDQAELSQNAPAFMDWFEGSGLEYHIGITSTDMIAPNHRGKLQPIPGESDLWIDQNTQDPVEKFRQAAVLGSGGAFPERGIDGCYHALETEDGGNNRGFQREDSALHAIAITDEDDFSLDIAHSEFIRWFDGLRNPADRSFSAIHNPFPGASGSGYKYGAAAEELDGEVWDINATSWAEMLDILGLKATGRRAEFFLSQQPHDSTIIVEVEVQTNDGSFAIVRPLEAEFDDEGRLLSGGWKYSSIRNSIVFYDYLPPDLAIISVTYAPLDGVIPQEDEETGGGTLP